MPTSSKYLFLVLLLLISFNDLEAQNVNGSIIHDGVEREYILYIPSSYTAGNSAPLVINLHGYGSNRGEQLIYSNFTPTADEHGFLVVHPQGSLNNVGSTHWNANWGTGVDDVGFISALIDSLSVDYAVDLDRVYSTGMSNGGFMSYTLACQLSDRIAAIASVTGTMTIGQAALCDSPKAVPVMEIHGTADGVVPYGGSNLGVGIDNVIDFWVNKNACDTDPQITMIEDTNMSDDSTVEHYVYSNGTDGSSVELYKIIGGGHTWPGAFNIGDVTNQDISATAKIWEFFSKYTLNGLLTSNEIIDSAKAVSIIPNPATDLVYLEFENDMSAKFISIYDIAGKVIKQIKSPTDKLQIDVAGWTPATYFIQIYTDNEVVTKKMIVIEK